MKLEMASVVSNKLENPEALLTEPTSEMKNNPFRLKRDVSSFSSKSSQFTVASKNFERQFSHIYAKRLEALKPRVQETMKALWPETVTFARRLQFSISAR